MNNPKCPNITIRVKALRDDAEPRLQPLIPEGPVTNPLEQVDAALFAAAHFPGVE